MIRRLRYLAGSLKLRLALASFVLIAASVALTVVLVLRAMEQRSQRAVLDSEVANAERIGLVLSAKIVSLQKALRVASADLPAADLHEPAAVGAVPLVQGRFQGGVGGHRWGLSVFGPRP